MAVNILNRLFAKNAINGIKMVRYSTEVTVNSSPLAVKKQKVSRAMKSYLERAEEHDAFIKTQTIEFQIGKRHLANMMGEDADNFTQEDIDNAIAYLFPSGIHDKKARPLMRHPEEIFPARKAAEFDETGRPFHTMFYTGKPNFFRLLYDTVEEINKVQKFEDIMVRKGKREDDHQKFDLTGFEVISKEQLETRLVEQIIDLEYKNFENALTRLASLPYSSKSKEFIEKYTKPLMDQSKVAEIPKPRFDEQGRQFITTYECLRKSARADVTLRFPGTGVISINGNNNIMHFEDLQPREQILFPLIFTGMLGKMDVEANVAGGGPSGQAGAIRWGISMGLRSFVDQEVVEKMRVAGLLTRDYRRRERKKPGQEGARRKFTWKKR